MTNVNEAIAQAIVDSKAEVDWDAVQAAVKAAHQQEETEAAELEGLAPMPADLIALREEKLKLDEELDKLNARKDQIKDIFGERLKKDGMVGYMLHGKVHARRSNRTRTDVDRKRLKEEQPEIYKNYLKTTAYIAITVN